MESPKMVNEEKEKRFYEYIQKDIYKGNYEFPSWQAVCRERAFCYDRKMTHEDMSKAFEVHTIWRIRKYYYIGYGGFWQSPPIFLYMEE